MSAGDAERLPEILSSIRRPLQYVARNNFANLGTVRGLEQSVGGMVGDALQAAEGQEPVAGILKKIQLLFGDFEEMEPDQQASKVSEASP